MGLFGGKKTYVSSVVYNLGGDVADRPNFLKTTVIGSTLVQDGRSKADLITSSYQSGRGIKLRNYYRWALDNYSAIGVPHGTLKGTIEIDPSKVAGVIPRPEGTTAMVQTVEMGAADFAYWAEQWMFENNRALIGTAWTSDYNDATGKIEILFANNTTAEFAPVGFNKSAEYIYAIYTLDLGTSVGTLVPGTEVILSAIENYPTLAGWTTLVSSAVPVTETLPVKTTVTESFSDNRPNQVTVTPTTRDELYNRTDSSYRKVTYQGETINVTTGVDKLTATESTMYVFLTATSYEDVSSSTTTVVITGGVTKTTVTEVRQGKLSYKRSYRIDTIQKVVQNWSPAKVLIYRIGSGNLALDALSKSVSSAVTGQADRDGYLPFIPLRIDNKFVSSTHLPLAYEAAKKAYKKSVGGKIDDIIAKLTDNPSLKDVDYAYVMFGASINTKEQASRKYIYAFFDRLRVSNTDRTAFTRYQERQGLADQSLAELIAWRLAQKVSVSPAYGSDSPFFEGSSGAPLTQVNIQATGPALNSNVDIRISWNSIVQTKGLGLLKPDAKPGDIWFQPAGASPASTSNSVVLSIGSMITGSSSSPNTIEMCFQVSATRWKKLTIAGLIHRNYIYQGKYVETNIAAALADVDESDFIIPLHYNTFREMSIVDATQMAGECTYLVINSYQVVKQKWYQTGIFKIILIIVVIAIIYFSGGFGAGAVGLLGTSAAVGAAVGLTGLAAIIAGFAINALAAMILVRLIQLGAVELFGEKVGLIIGTIVGIAAVAAGTGLMNGQTAASIFSTMTRADSLIAMTSALGSAAAQVVAINARDYATKSAGLLEDYSKETRALTDLYAKNLGYDNGVFDPTSLTNAPGQLLESPDSFLARTLMTGSDIADLSMQMLYRFTQVNLDTKLSL